MKIKLSGGKKQESRDLEKGRKNFISRKNRGETSDWEKKKNVFRAGTSPSKG